MNHLNFGTPRRWRATTLTGTLFYAICGVLLLVWPDEALAIANYALAILLVLVGVLGIIGYCKASPVMGALGFSMSLSLLAVTAGVVLFCAPSLLATLLPFVWGISLIAGGFVKLQMASDMRRMGVARGWLILIGAVFSFLLGVAAIFRPAFIATVATQFVGISLLVEAVIDLVCTLTINNRIKSLYPDVYNS